MKALRLSLAVLLLASAGTLLLLAPQLPAVGQSRAAAAEPATPAAAELWSLAPVVKPDLPPVARQD